MTTLSGCDLSTYQGTPNWDVLKNNVNFVIIKSTEGSGFTDPQFRRNQSEARRVGIPRGFYHFARCDLGNSGVQEANWFLQVVGPLQPGESLYLDYEVQWGGDNVKWVLDFVNTISNNLNGYKPLFYSYQSMLTSHDWTPVVKLGVGLWVAAPGSPTNTNFQTGAWPFAGLLQWGTQAIPGVVGQVDSDTFFGDAVAFQKYGYQPPASPPDYKKISQAVKSEIGSMDNDNIKVIKIRDLVASV
jgi:lysozyme